jgi:hypothetical protein
MNADLVLKISNALHSCAPHYIAVYWFTDECYGQSACAESILGNVCMSVVGGSQDNAEFEFQKGPELNTRKTLLLNVQYLRWQLIINLKSCVRMGSWPILSFYLCIWRTEKILSHRSLCPWRDSNGRQVRNLTSWEKLLSKLSWMIKTIRSIMLHILPTFQR